MLELTQSHIQPWNPTFSLQAYLYLVPSVRSNNNRPPYIIEMQALLNSTLDPPPDCTLEGIESLSAMKIGPIIIQGVNTEIVNPDLRSCCVCFGFFIRNLCQ